MHCRVGHIVWFRTATWDEGPLVDLAAIVTRVREDVVDLMVFEPDVDPYHRRDVPHDPTGSTRDSWRWPVDQPDSPYR